MSTEPESQPWTWEQIDPMLALIPTLEAPGFDPATWPTFEELKRPDGTLSLPYPTYHPAIERLFELVPFVHPYQRLPEDEDQDGEFDTRRIDHSPEFLGGATAQQVLRYLVLTRRSERFGDGHIDANFRRGSVLAALYRLRELRLQG